jgi:hypothetical protein
MIKNSIINVCQLTLILLLLHIDNLVCCLKIFYLSVQALEKQVEKRAFCELFCSVSQSPDEFDMFQSNNQIV